MLYAIGNLYFEVFNYFTIYQLLFERKYSSGRVVAKLACIKVLIGEIRIGPGVGQRFGSPRDKAHSWQKEFLLILVATG